MSGKSGRIVAVGIIVLTALVGVYSFGGQGTHPTAEGCVTPRGFLLITAGPSGFNGSVDHVRPWPVIAVRIGSEVNIYVCNVDSVSAHGFAIDHYLDGGVALRPGESFRVSFMANRGGNFTIFCNVFCPVHAFMIGQLRVLS